MYLKPIKDKSYYTPGVHKTWLINNSIIFLVLLTFVSLKSYVFYHEAETKALEPPKVVEVVKPKTQLNPVVFYYCLDAGRGKDGAKADVIKACKDAATIELAQDNVKYTISKRDIVF